ncbi:hypothetical protein [Gloeothece verrucosa]|uniref:Uncharacterized protein n=1 Tax=Gloeothece verrucosa (strain PCC 7822) TaxID=497965 RepID=E0UHF4_GLOV7|nr:hypothetical protein [Gloeothece verrucosa]ADN12095.1 conserved hypothetical protein [Gloeothece verrucosa PCC 7822]
MNLKRYPKFRSLFLLCLIIVAIVSFNYLSIEKVDAADEQSGTSSRPQCSYHPEAYQELNLTNLKDELEGTGLIGSIHGASSSSKLFVLSVREPENFFNHREFSLVTYDRAAFKALTEVKRHDQVCIRGRFLANPSQQKHILVESLKILEPWSYKNDFKPYERKTALPEELKNQTSVIGKVHAVAADGGVMVIEYKDAVIPVFVQSPQLTKDLFRGDIIRLHYRLQNLPTQPTHLRLNLDLDKPLQMIDSIAAWHEKEIVVKGKLVKFPQSPQIKFDVYALAVDTGGITRYFTLVNFDDASEFEKIRQKLAQIWNDHLSTASSGRNMLINEDVVIEVRGRGNVVSPGQANPQILLSGVEDIQLLSYGATR